MATRQSEQAPGEAGRFRVSMRGRGRVVRSVLVAVEAARTAGRLQPWHEPAAELAVVLAQSLDSAIRVSDAQLIRQLTAELRVSLQGLPLRPAAPEGGAADGGTDGGAGTAWSQLVGAEPH